MPILSYLAYPVDGQAARLRADLDRIDACTVIPAENRDLFVITTETASRQAEKRLQERLREVDSLACLALVFGHADPEDGPHAALQEAPR